MALSPNNACACEPDCGDCMHWVGPLPPEPGGHCELNAGATCAEDSDCGTCGRCGGSPCSCSADVQLCNLECDVCDTETQDCYDEDSLCGTENCLDCIAGTCEDRCENTETPYCDNPNDQCVECLDDEDCAEPDPYCENGECVECEEDAHCADNPEGLHYCVDNECVECRSSADCGDGLCVANVCLPPCDSDGDCDPGDVCVGGICTTPCDGDEDCDGGMVCGGSGGCVQPCDGDGVCGSGQDCSGGICTDPCTGDGNCAPGQVCSGGGGCTDPCEGDGDCGSNQVCSGQVCTDPCTGGGDCPGSQICAGGVCDDPCSGDDDCAPGEACSGGTCDPGCTGDGDCPGGVCVGGVCQDSCTDSSQCGACQQCVNGSCSGPDTTCGDCQSWDNSTCSCESDCTPNQVCDDGICRNTCGPGVSCMDCQECVNGICEDNCDNCRTCIDDVCQDDCMDCQRCENETCVDDCPGCQDCVSDTCVDNDDNCTADDCEICDEATCRDRCPDENLVCDGEGTCVECLTNADCEGSPYGELCDTDLHLCVECLAEGDVCTEDGTYCAAEPLILEVTSVPSLGSDVISGETVTFTLDSSDKDCYLPEGERSVLVDDPIVIPWHADWPAGDWVWTETGLEWVVPPVCEDSPLSFEISAVNAVDTDTYMEYASQGVQFTIKYELIEEVEWTPFTELPPYLPDGCNGILPCDGPDGQLRSDDCGNTLDLACAGADGGAGGIGGCAWRYIYNGMVISSCIWPEGTNTWYYKKSYIGESDSWVFSELRHSSQDPSCGAGCPDHKTCALTTVPLTSSDIPVS